MKRITLVLLVAVAVSSCGADEKKPALENKVEKAKPMDPEVDKGLGLVVTNDCLVCHQAEEKLKGPSYMEIAKKYAGNPAIEDTLVQRIIKGSVGHWGQEIMTPHPTLSADDAKAMVKYVLSLNQ